jgi:hypothetical protein
MGEFAGRHWPLMSADRFAGSGNSGGESWSKLSEGAESSVW